MLPSASALFYPVPHKVKVKSEGRGAPPRTLPALEKRGKDKTCGFVR